MRLDGSRIVVKGPANRTRPAVERVLRNAGRALTTTEIVTLVKRDRSNVTRALNELHADDRVRRSGGRGKTLMWEWIGA
jgi:DNA-binding IclR family transcriptional regulator